jgi:hypothetical protein
MINLSMTDGNGVTHKCLIEAQTSAQYKKITKRVFNKHILEEFIGCDPTRKYTWIVTVTQDNVERVKPLADKHGILIMPIRTEIREQIEQMVKEHAR